MTGPNISADLNNRRLTNILGFSANDIMYNIVTSEDWRPGVSVPVVVGRSPPHRPPVLHYGQSSLDVIEKIRNWIQIVAAGGKSSEDCKINKNDC